MLKGVVQRPGRLAAGCVVGLVLVYVTAVLTVPGQGTSCLGASPGLSHGTPAMGLISRNPFRRTKRCASMKFNEGRAY